MGLGPGATADAQGLFNGAISVGTDAETTSKGEATGLVVATYISQWADPTFPSARTPGLHPMGLIVEPEPFLLGLASRSFRIE